MVKILNMDISSNIKIVIPARYQSTRLPQKPLRDIDGMPMIWHTYQRALETGIDADSIVIATDHQDIISACESFGANVTMTREDHESGTDRLAEVAQLFKWNDSVVVVNVQGDEPLVPSELINLTAETLIESKADMSTVGCPITSMNEVKDPNCVKLIADINGRALYFSRASIPFSRDGFNSDLLESEESPWLRHIGMYAYTVATLKKLTSSSIAVIENLEKLEQLRALYLGLSIQVAVIKEAPSHGVDTLEDLNRIRKLF